MLCYHGITEEKATSDADENQRTAGKAQSHARQFGEEGRSKKRNHTLHGEGKYNPSLKLAYDVSKALKTTIDELFLFDDENTE